MMIPVYDARKKTRFWNNFGNLQAVSWKKRQSLSEQVRHHLQTRLPKGHFVAPTTSLSISAADRCNFSPAIDIRHCGVCGFVGWMDSRYGFRRDPVATSPQFLGLFATVRRHGPIRQLSDPWPSCRWTARRLHTRLAGNPSRSIIRAFAGFLGQSHSSNRVGAFRGGRHCQPPGLRMPIWASTKACAAPFYGITSVLPRVLLELFLVDLSNLRLLNRDDGTGPGIDKPCGATPGCLPLGRVVLLPGLPAQNSQILPCPSTGTEYRALLREGGSEHVEDHNSYL